MSERDRHGQFRDTIAEKPPRVASLEEIADYAAQIASELHDVAPSVGKEMREAWDECSSELMFDGEKWKCQHEVFFKLFKKVRKAADRLNTPKIFKLTALLDSRRYLHDDWHSLAAFLQHDTYHTTPFEIMNLYIELEYLIQLNNQTQLLQRHKEFFDLAFSHSEALARQFIFPIEFIEMVAKLQEKKFIPSSKTNVKELLTNIILLVAGRSSADDYNLVFDNKPVDLSRNNLILKVPDSLEIDVNPSLLFGIVYNLVKNAIKANRKKHYFLQDPPVGKIYQGEKLQNPMNLEITVTQSSDSLEISVVDQGNGISLDQALNRFQAQLSRRIEEDGLANVLTSEWCHAIRKALGESQANYLFGWPTHAFDLRGVEVGSIFDLHFVAGFDPDDLESRSVSSGMGLWGVRYIVDHLGGSVAGTNTFDGGAVFSLRIPTVGAQTEAVQVA